jgi:hypothetical protein
MLTPVGSTATEKLVKDIRRAMRKQYSAEETAGQPF